MKNGTWPRTFSIDRSVFFGCIYGVVFLLRVMYAWSRVKGECKFIMYACFV